MFGWELQRAQGLSEERQNAIETLLLQTRKTIIYVCKKKKEIKKKSVIIVK